MKTTNHQLKAYSNSARMLMGSTFAAAALVPGSAIGQISYTDVDPDLPFNLDFSFDTTRLDITGDGMADLQLTHRPLSYGLGIPLEALNPDLDFAGKHFYSFINSCEWDSIGRGMQYMKLDDDRDFYASAYVFINTFPCGPGGGWSAEDEDGYIGFRLMEPDGPHYGWIRFSRLLDDGFTERWLIRDYAIHDAPDSTIRMGDPGDVCLVPKLADWTLAGTTITMNWEKVPRADGYQVEGTRVGSGVVKSKKTGTNSLTYSGLKAGKTYEWRVAAACPTDTSAPGAWNSFTVPVLKQAQAALSGSLYPNPAGDQTVLRLTASAEALSEGSAADRRLGWSLFDATGRLLRQGEMSVEHLAGYADGQVPEGLPINLAIDLRDLPEGIYLLSARLGDRQWSGRVFHSAY